MKPPKHLICRAFDQAAATYDSAAEVQRFACQKLATDLDDPGSGLILDAGCGTGYGLRLLLECFPKASGIGLDLSLAMLAKANHAEVIAGDIEHLPFAAESVDLYWTSLTAQWCALDTLLDEAMRVLRPDGQLALATLGTQTFRELRTAFSASDGHTHTLNFLSPEAAGISARQAGFSNIQVEHHPLITYHSQFKPLLASIKAIGANQVGAGRRRGLMSRAAWQRAEAAYEALRLPEGLPLTYDLVFLKAAKPLPELV